MSLRTGDTGRVFTFISKSNRPINLRSVRKILEETKIIWQLPTTNYALYGGRYVPDDYANYQDYFDLYNYMGPIGRAINLKNQLIWQNGFTTSADSDATKKKADDLMTKLDFDLKVNHGTLTALICGNAYFEIIQDPELQLKELDPFTISAKVDKDTGEVLQWTQTIYGKPEVNFEPDELFHIAFNPLRSSIFGIGNLRRVLFTAKAILYMRQKVPEIVRKRADHPLLAHIGDKEHRASDEVYNRIKAELKNRVPGEDVIDDGWITFDEIYKSLSGSRISGVVDLLKVFERDLISGLGVPEEALGYGQSTTQATALYQKEQLEEETRNYQRIIKRNIESQIFPLEDLQGVKIVWNPLNPEDQNLLSTRFQGEIKTGIIGPKFARKKLGYAEDEAGEGAFPWSGAGGIG